VFSQTELTRQALGNDLSISLLDSHAPDADAAKAELRESALVVSARTTALLKLADRAKDLRVKVENPVDGLAQSDAALTELTGDPAVMNRVRDYDRIQQWHALMQKSLEAWRIAAQIAPFVVPATPQLSTPEQADLYVPRDTLAALVGTFEQESKALIDNFVNGVSARLSATTPEVEKLRASVQSDLEALGMGSAEEFQERTRQLRGHVAALGAAAAELTDLDTRIAAELPDILRLIQVSWDARRKLTNTRRQAAATINQTLSEFRCDVNPSGELTALTQLLVDLKVGTWFQESTVTAIRDSLNRGEFLTFAVRHRQGLQPNPTADTQDDIARVASEKRRDASIAQLLTWWPGDSFTLKTTGSPAESFESLTPGRKALAIKELSFAASSLPVLSDQPEDAISTTAVFDSLVPTIRAQRRTRQFIFASHDANIVVAGDAERVIILPREDSPSVTTGTLFDADIRNAALKLLEGGNAAFEQRRRRYGLVERPGPPANAAP